MGGVEGYAGHVRHYVHPPLAPAENFAEMEAARKKNLARYVTRMKIFFSL